MQSVGKDPDLSEKLKEWRMFVQSKGHPLVVDNLRYYLDHWISGHLSCILGFANFIFSEVW